MRQRILRILCSLALVVCCMVCSSNVNALVVPEKPNAEPAKSNSVKGQMAEKYDTKLPVEISSDNLEVFQNQNKAIFKGNVIAVQGKIRLAADTMIVHYKQKNDQSGQQQPPKVKANSSQDSGSMGAITLIEVEGNVFLATPEESARGDKGDYQVPEKLLHLTGDNVILTRGKNILRGNALVYDLESGHSTLTNNGQKVTGKNRGRVRGVFVPTQEQSNDKNKGKDKVNDKHKTEATPAVNTTP